MYRPIPSNLTVKRINNVLKRLNILLPSSINDKYLSSVTNNRGVNIPLLPDKLKESFNKRCWNNILKI